MNLISGHQACVGPGSRAIKSAMLTAKRLRKILRYDPKTGSFRWKVTISSRATSSSVAGALGRRGQQPSKRKRRRIGLPALGAAGVSLVMAGGAAGNAPTANVPSLQDTSLRPGITLDEEEIADVRLGTFYVFDKENESQLGQGIRLAARGGGRGGSCGGGGGGAAG